MDHRPDPTRVLLCHIANSAYQRFRRRESTVDRGVISQMVTVWGRHTSPIHQNERELWDPEAHLDAVLCGSGSGSGSVSVSFGMLE
jgi:hypothetical protein